MEWIKLSVVLYIVFVTKCSAMSKSEIEDFANFLHKTSRLDQTLKKGTDPDDDDDEDEHISDHAWEDSGKFEGDLILNERQRRLIVEEVAEGLSRNGLKDGTKRWPDNEVIYYIQKEHFNADQLQAIQDGIQDIAQASCVKFRPYRKGDRDAVVIQGSRRGCFSQVGYQSGYQVLNLNARHPAGRGCFRHGTVVHELLHTLGFYHMQSSPDRDDYVDIIWGNIHQQAKNNFRKYNPFSVSDFGVGYDYDSVLHYSRRAFSINGRDTIVPKKSGVSIGQRVGLSDKDTEKLNRMYCDANSNDAAEETTQKVTKKKNPKNKPFDGHGIGYHQGKAVAIKILPTAQTYQLPAIPIHMFNYFSKAPQTMSTSKTQGIGKHIDYAYNPPATFSPQYYRSFEKTEQKDTPMNSFHTRNQESNMPEKEELSDEKHAPNKSSAKAPLEAENSDRSSEESKDLNYRFDVDELAKTIKILNQPSYIPYNVHEYNEDLKQHPAEKKEAPFINRNSEEQAIHYIDKLYDSSAEKFVLKEKQQNKDHAKLKNNESKSAESPESDDLPLDDDSMKSYRTSFLNYFKPDEHIPSPEHVKPANLLNRHNYSSLYDDNSKARDDEDDEPKKYKVLGEPVPIYEDWYKNHEQKFHPYNDNENSKTRKEDDEPKKKYKLLGEHVPPYEDWYKNHEQEFHPYIDNDDDDDRSRADHHSNLSTPERNSESGKDQNPNKAGSNKLFGVPVPLSQSWYNHR